MQADRAPPWPAQTVPASCNLPSVPLYDALASTKPQVERSRILAALVSVTHMLSCPRDSPQRAQAVVGPQPGGVPQQLQLAAEHRRVRRDETHEQREQGDVTKLGMEGCKGRQGAAGGWERRLDPFGNPSRMLPSTLLCAGYSCKKSVQLTCGTSCGRGCCPVTTRCISPTGTCRPSASVAIARCSCTSSAGPARVTGPNLAGA